MYKECPRLQYLLEQNPDIRPVFEDPALVRINFETVYREAGGVLPEEEAHAVLAEAKAKQKKSWIVRIANSPLFKLIKVALFFKKVIGCIAGGGIAAIGGCIACATDCCTDCCCEDALEQISVDGDGSVDLDDGDYDEMEFGVEGAPPDPNAEALNHAAEYMEDPDVQEQMQRLLEDPDNLADAIENDTELRTLRDSNPLCAELVRGSLLLSTIYIYIYIHIYSNYILIIVVYICTFFLFFIMHHGGFLLGTIMMQDARSGNDENFSRSR